MGRLTDAELITWEDQGEMPPENQRKVWPNLKPPAKWFNAFFYNIFRSLFQIDQNAAKASDLSAHIGAVGDAHGIASSSNAGFMSPNMFDKFSSIQVSSPGVIDLLDYNDINFSGNTEYMEISNSEFSWSSGFATGRSVYLEVILRPDTENTLYVELYNKTSNTSIVSLSSGGVGSLTIVRLRSVAINIPDNAELIIRRKDSNIDSQSKVMKARLIIL